MTRLQKFDTELRQRGFETKVTNDPTLPLRYGVTLPQGGVYANLLRAETDFVMLYVSITGSDWEPEDGSAVERRLSFFNMPMQNRTPDVTRVEERFHARLHGQVTSDELVTLIQEIADAYASARADMGGQS